MNSAALISDSVSFPETVFPLGLNIDAVPPSMRLRNQRQGLSLGALLDSTPVHWVRLPAFRMAPRMITNGEYAQFLADGANSDDGGAFESPGLWQYVWRDSGYQLTSHSNFSLVGLKSLNYVDDYNGAVNFVEAYILSLKYELERVLVAADSNLEGQYSSRLIRRDAPELNEIFAFLRFKLRHVLTLDEHEDWWANQSPKDRQLLRELSSNGDVVDAVVERLDKLTDKLTRIFDAGIDSKLKQNGFGVQSVESLRFLNNFRNAVHKQRPEDPIYLRQLLYPRNWRSPTQYKQRASGSFRPPSGRIGRGGPVAWEDRPVMNITLYEALAYTAWLSQQTNWQRVFTLPNEAQYERAASWPVIQDHNKNRADPFDLSQKQLYPWGHSTGDFHDYFGKDGQTLNTVYSDSQLYKSLLNKTARWINDDSDHDGTPVDFAPAATSQSPGRIDQLLGFGWHWTCDRFDTRMPRYERIRHLNQVDQNLTDSAHAPRFVYDYDENRHLDQCDFVVRGAPYNSGGPGLTTRRFALFPLRGYPNVGFRWVENIEEMQ